MLTGNSSRHNLFLHDAALQAFDLIFGFLRENDM